MEKAEKLHGVELQSGVPRQLAAIERALKENTFGILSNRWRLGTSSCDASIVAVLSSHHLRSQGGQSIQSAVAQETRSLTPTSTWACAPKETAAAGPTATTS